MNTFCGALTNYSTLPSQQMTVSDDGAEDAKCTSQIFEPIYK